MPDWPCRRKNWDMPSLLPPTQSQLRGWLGLLRLPSGRVGEGEDVIYLSSCVALYIGVTTTAAPCIERHQSVGLHKSLEGFVPDPRIFPGSAGAAYQVLAGMQLGVEVARQQLARSAEASEPSNLALSSLFWCTLF